MIGLYKGKSFTSKLIKWRSWSEYSHASWIDVARPRLLKDDIISPLSHVFEAWIPDGVVERQNISDGHTKGTPIDLFDIQLTDGERQALMRFLRMQIGQKYDYRGVLKFMSRREGQTPDAWFCSELIFAAFQHICRPLLLRIPTWKVAPGMLAYSPLLKFVGTITT